MSGGAFEYLFFNIEQTYSGCLHDEELEKMLIDFCDLLHDLEWWESGDISEETYRKTVREFKEKWFNCGREERLIPIINEKLDEVKDSIMEIIRYERIVEGK